MNIVRGLALVLALTLWVPSTSIAQQNNPHNGKWLAKYISIMGNQFDANVVVKDSGGTWATNFSSPNNPCLGLIVPIEVRRPATDTLEISVWGAKALRGCRNFKLTVKRVDDNTLAGQFDDGREVTLVRQ